MGGGGDRAQLSKAGQVCSVYDMIDVDAINGKRRSFQKKFQHKINRVDSKYE